MKSLNFECIEQQMCLQRTKQLQEPSQKVWYQLLQPSSMSIESTVARIWRGAKENFAAKRVMKSVSKIKKNSGRHHKYDSAMVKQAKTDNFEKKDLETLRNVSKKL